MLSPEAITKFQAIYKKLYGEEIDDAVAKDKGTRLINFVKILMNVEAKVKNNPNSHE